MGTIYERKNSKFLWIKYYKNGKPYAESTHSDKLEVARRLLKLREGEISQGRLPGICFDKVKINELLDDLITDYKLNQRKSQKRAEQCKTHLEDFFGGMRCPDITTAKVKEYITQRLEQEAKNGTINRELSALKRAFSLATECTPPKVVQIPHVPMLEERNTRKGFFEHQDYLTLIEALPAYLRPIVAFAYRTAWRKNEILNLSWNQIDFKENTVRLEAGESKNEEGRTIYLDSELEKILLNQKRLRRLGCPYVFHRNGEKVQGFRKAWITACEKAGIPGKLFHDLRRTAVRNLVRSGVPERVAMQISGHKTRNVFDRYNIVSPEDLKIAAAKQEAYLNGM